MQISVINQYPQQADTSQRLRRLFSEFSVLPKPQFRCLTAFTSLNGLDEIDAGVRRLLTCGGSVYYISGIDLGGTSKEALQRLLEWKKAFSKQVDARIFSTFDNRTIFHPKVYWFDSLPRRVVIVGSANATKGGLSGNFEVSLEIDLGTGGNGSALEQLDQLWITYSSPLPPLQKTNLVDVTRALVKKLHNGRVPTDARPNLPHPLASMRPRAARQRRQSQPSMVANQVELLMDILEETRRTQVQLPVETLSPFFQNRASIDLIYVRGGKALKSDLRPFIHLANNTHRLEVDAIRGLPRPQIARFWRSRSSAAKVYYEIVLRGTSRYQQFDQLLRQNGNQTRSDTRRWLLR
jgi:hypothetical protein